MHKDSTSPVKAEPASCCQQMHACSHPNHMSENISMCSNLICVRVKFQLSFCSVLMSTNHSLFCQLLLCLTDQLLLLSESSSDGGRPHFSGERLRVDQLEPILHPATPCFSSSSPLSSAFCSQSLSFAQTEQKLLSKVLLQFLVIVYVKCEDT